jgi:hypothetical protein
MILKGKMPSREMIHTIVNTPNSTLQKVNFPAYFAILAPWKRKKEIGRAQFNLE